MGIPISVIFIPGRIVSDKPAFSSQNCLHRTQCRGCNRTQCSYHYQSIIQFPIKEVKETNESDLSYFGFSIHCLHRTQCRGCNGTQCSYHYQSIIQFPIKEVKETNESDLSYFGFSIHFSCTICIRFKHIPCCSVRFPLAEVAIREQISHHICGKAVCWALDGCSVVR